MSAEMKQFIRL